MKKIMFNDKFQLTKAVLEGRKEQTRRIIKCPREFKGEWVAGFNIHIRQSDKKVVGWPCMYDADEREFEGGELLPRYKVGEIVAVAQSYSDCGHFPDYELDEDGYPIMPKNSGYFNKMFVKADLMPYRIKIINVHIERLQDISEEDCLAEGVYAYYYGDEEEKKFYEIPPNGYSFDGIGCHYSTPRAAYAELIDKVSGKGTWESNPWVFVYDFELIK